MHNTVGESIECCVPDRSSLGVPHEVVALPLLQLLHGAHVVKYTPKRLDRLDHAYLPQVGKEFAGIAALWGPEGRRKRQLTTDGSGSSSPVVPKGPGRM